MTEDTIHAIIKDAHELAKADAAPDITRAGAETIARRLERLVKHGFYVAPESINKFAREEVAADVPPADAPIDPNGPTLNQILLNPPLPELTAPVVRTRIVVTPNGAAMKYDPLDDELPRLSASIEMVQDVGDEEPSQRATLYVGGKVLAHMKIYRGKHFAVRMVKQALKAQEQMFNDSNFANGECKLGCPECDNPRVGCKIAWLFAPATEQEGGAK